MQRLESTDTEASSVFTKGPFAWFSRMSATVVAGAVLAARQAKTSATGQAWGTGKSRGKSVSAKYTNRTAPAASKQPMYSTRRRALCKRR